jgi:pilus assembly protein Flp/PilA
MALGRAGEQLEARNDCSLTKEMIMSKFVTRFLKDESGATAIEYGLIAALIAVVLVTAMGALGTQLGSTFSKISGQLAAANP